MGNGGKNESLYACVIDIEGYGTIVPVVFALYYSRKNLETSHSENTYAATMEGTAVCDKPEDLFCNKLYQRISKTDIYLHELN